MKKLTSTQVWIFVQQLALALTAIAAEILADPQIVGLFPPKYAHGLAVVALIGMKLRSMKNLTINPDGTPATIAYVPPGEPKP
jgi:hypothetical protein